MGLVLVTTVAVAATAHFLVDGMSWPAAFVLGAIVSPTDPVAATTIARRLGIPRRIVTVVEGEALVNDGTALIAYRFALAAVATGTFSLFDAGLTFVLSAVGGVAIGLGVGWVVAHVRRRLDDPPVEITISLAYARLRAEVLGAERSALLRLRGEGAWALAGRLRPAAAPAPRTAAPRRSSRTGRGRRGGAPRERPPPAGSCAR